MKLLVSITLFMVAGCQARGESSAVLARIGDAVITEADLEREIAREPEAVRGRYASAEARNKLLEGMIRFEVMAQAAEARGLLRDPDVVRAARQQAVNKLIAAEIGARTGPDTISAGDVASYYAEHKDRLFSTPPAAHVAHVLCTDEAAAARVAAAARALVRDDQEGFARLAREFSQDSLTRNTGGDLGFIDARGPHPKEIVEAALALDRPGDVAGPVRAADGWHVLRLSARRAAFVRAQRDVEDVIRQEIERERRTAALEALIATLRKDARVELDSKR